MAGRSALRRHGACIEALETRRLLAVPGALDPTFSGDGKASFSIGGLNAVDVAVQPDGKTVVAGTHTDSGGNVNLALARFNVDGQPDSTFGSGGLAITQLFNLSDERIHAVAIAPDGKIVVAGSVQPGTTEDELLVYRYNANGTVDTTFNGNGRVILDLGDFAGDTEAFDVAVQSDGFIVVVGATYKVPDYDFFVMRLNTNGDLDRDVRDPVTGSLLYQGFDFDGVKTIGFGGGDEASAVRLDNAGNIYVAGTANISGNRFAGVTKLSRLGGFVSSFDNDGKANFGVPGRTVTIVEDLIVQGDKVIIAGHALNPANGQNDFFVARFTADGQPDETFGETSQGFTVTDLGGNDTVKGITLTPSGGGGGFIVSGGSGGMAAVKYTDNGLLDSSFGTGGKVKLGFGGMANIAPWVGRRIVLAGGANFSTARLLLNGAREVNAFALDSLAIEGTTNTGRFFVGRTERLPFATRVFFSIGGTATFAASRTAPRDYGMTGMVFPQTIGGTAFVDIPAGQTSVTLTLVTFNDTLREPTESASFSMVPNSLYEISSPSSGTINIQDDDTSNSSIGTTTVAKPPKQVGVGQELQAAVTWTVPTGGWRQLSTIQLRLRNLKDGGALAILTFDEATNSFSVESTPGANNPVSLVLSKSTFQAAGPTAATVTVIFTFHFNASAVHQRFALDVAASNDSGAFSGFAQIGELHVHKKPKR